MKKARTQSGLEIGLGEAALMKSVTDGVSVRVAIDERYEPAPLHLVFSWPNALPQQIIDFVLIALNNGHSFLAAFRYTSFGLQMAYSEHTNPMLAYDLLNTRTVTIQESGDDISREYECELKHCLD